MENNKWRIEIQGGGQIADTGDYDDGYYVLTNGDIELVTKDEVDTDDPDIYSITMAVEILNKLDHKWEDWKLSNKEYELYLEQENCKKWKQVAGELYEALYNPSSHMALPIIRKYEKLLKELP